LGFAQLLISLLDEGRRTATYKLAVLLALIDSCMLGTDADGRSPAHISTRDLARRVIELYWPQVRPFPVAADRTEVLRQSSQPRAITVEAVQQLRAAASALGATTPYLAEQWAPAEYTACLDTVELNLVRMPLGKLQRPLGFTEAGSAEYPRFLYDDAPFHAGVTPKHLRAAPLTVDLRPGVGDWLVALSGLLRPLLELHWTREVARFNRQELAEDRLREFLFGTARVALQRLAPGLRELQSDRCFYCSGPLRSGEVEVDHFVPWSRVPNDALANLVLADRRCNNAKRDNLAALPLLERWALRRPDVLASLADEARWPLRSDESMRVARGIYSHQPFGAQLWTAPGVYELMDRERLTQLLALLETP
jgi:hypothetical protein